MLGSRLEMLAEMKNKPAIPAIYEKGCVKGWFVRLKWSI